MYTLLPKMADVVAPLRSPLEEMLGCGQRTERVVNNKLITEEHWTLEWKE